MASKDMAGRQVSPARRLLFVSMSFALALVGSVVVPMVPAAAATGDVLAKGQRYCADTYNGHSHDGRALAQVVDINFPGDNGAPLYAPGPGNVTSGTHEDWGNFVWWTSSDGVERIYLGHLATFGKIGAVKGGDQIGTIGSTGKRSDGPHLHVHRNVNGKAAPVILSGAEIKPSLVPGNMVGKWPCNGTTYTSAGPAGGGQSVATPSSSAGGGQSAALNFSMTSGRQAVGINADGRIENYMIGENGQFYFRYQTSRNGVWSNWVSAGGSWRQGASVGVGRNADGRLETYVVGTNGRLYARFQTSVNGGWTGWNDMGGSFPSGAPVGVGVNADGRLENYIVGTNGQFYFRYQTSRNGTWSGWHSAGGTLKQGASVGVGRNADGRLETYVVGTNGRLYARFQTSVNGGWTGWNDMGGSFPSGAPIGVGVNADGRLENYIVGTKGPLQSRYQTSVNGGWANWYSAGGTWPR